MEKRAVVLVFLTAIVSGVSIFANKFAVSGINSSVFTFLKNSMVALFLFSLILLLGELPRLRSLTKKNWLMLALVGFVGGSLPFLLYFRGLQLTSSSNASFIHKTMFVYVIVLAALFLKEKINKTVVLSALALLVGNALIIGFDHLAIGDLLIVAATMLWAIENVLSKHLLKDIPWKLVAFSRMFFGSLFILCFLALTDQLHFVGTLSSAQIGWILLTSAFLVLYTLTWYGGLSGVKVSTAASILCLGSVITTLLDHYFFMASLAWTQLIGMLLLVVGVFGTLGITKLIFAHNARWS
ncbi:MAG: DMT family transporter [Candidatus Woesearchaeota archaeon]